MEPKTVEQYLVMSGDEVKPRIPKLESGSLPLGNTLISFFFSLNQTIN